MICIWINGFWFKIFKYSWKKSYIKNMRATPDCSAAELCSQGLHWHSSGCLQAATSSSNKFNLGYHLVCSHRSRFWFALSKAVSATTWVMTCCCLHPNFWWCRFQHLDGWLDGGITVSPLLASEQHFGGHLFIAAPLIRVAYYSWD